jgi:hypothetical protein
MSFRNRDIHRRNTGYAVDMLLNTDAFIPGKPAFNFCALLKWFGRNVVLL